MDTVTVLYRGHILKLDPAIVKAHPNRPWQEVEGSPEANQT